MASCWGRERAEAAAPSTHRLSPRHRLAICDLQLFPHASVPRCENSRFVFSMFERRCAVRKKGKRVADDVSYCVRFLWLGSHVGRHRGA